ncbi:hypothetical protein FOA52_015228 [Chlamydomonas sp. UWO 241]|nr:hypothetical protein FOA52_015228 [Chlamydomonas sp. UWO 241]
MARRYHPDVNSDPDAQLRFKAISQAYAVLTDEQLRAGYDRYGTRALSGRSEHAELRALLSRCSPQRRPPSQEPGSRGGQYGVGDVRPRREEETGEEGEEYAARFRSAPPERGVDVYTVLGVTLSEAVTGVTKTLAVQIDVPCAQCGGEGAAAPRAACRGCRGTGTAWRSVWDSPAAAAAVGAGGARVADEDQEGACAGSGGGAWARGGGGGGGGGWVGSAAGGGGGGAGMRGGRAKSMPMLADCPACAGSGAAPSLACSPCG